MSVQKNVNELYMDLVGKQMCACGEVRHVENSLTKWTMECQLYKPGNKEKAKDGIRQFLQECWEAEEIKFFTKHGSKPGQFWVSFKSVEF